MNAPNDGGRIGNAVLVDCTIFGVRLRIMLPNSYKNAEFHVLHCTANWCIHERRYLKVQMQKGLKS